MVFSGLRTSIDTYVPHKKWYWYVPAWLVGAYIFVGLLHFSSNKPLPFLISIAQALDFALHEMAHVLTGFLPAIICAAAGSFTEIALGLVLLVAAFKERKYFTVFVTSLWFMLACQSVGSYMADARAQTIQLVSLGGAISGSDQAIHDWNFIFGKLGILRFDTLIGGSVRK